MRTSSSNKPLIVITGGDPSGIGPEIILKSLQDPRITAGSRIKIIGNLDVFKEIAKKLKLKIETGGKGVDFVHVPVRKPAGRASVEYILYGAALVQNTPGACLVTAPINKESIKKDGFDFEGHTELLSRITKSPLVTMMLVGGPLRVSLVTRHVPLKDVPARITKKEIILTAENTYFALKKYFGIKHPRIGIAGVNPHAADEGSAIMSAVKSLKKKMKGVSGPHPADALFYKAYHGGVDAVVSMYHDQGLAPLKMIAFEKGVNITIGLPFIRTSPDHGTAFDIAGKGMADPSSMKEAIRLAIKFSEKRFC